MLRKFFAGVAALCLAAAGLGAYIFLDRPVRVIEVSGELAAGEAGEVRAIIEETLQGMDHGEPAAGWAGEVYAKISQASPGRLLSTDLAALRDQVLGLSWPRKVSIRRVWPDKILVGIERETVVAQWGDQGYLSPDGEVVRTPDANGEMPHLRCALTGPKAALETFRHLRTLLAGSFPADEGLAITALTENALGEWRVQLANGVQAALGAESLHERMQRFLLAYRHLSRQGDEPLQHLDLRYSNGVAVRWREQGEAPLADASSGAALLAER